MLVTEEKDQGEVLARMDGEVRTFLVGCGGCSEGCRTAGLPQLEKWKGILEGAGKQVTGLLMIDFLCNKTLDSIRLLRRKSQVESAESILVFSCGVGVQAVAAVAGKRVHAALNTVSLRGTPGLWRSTERCMECGECVLDWTGGICPIVSCSKSLVNGSCGGPKDGKCEVKPEQDCGWVRIYERLKALGRLGDLKRIIPPRDHKKMSGFLDWRGTRLWAVEQPAGEVARKGSGEGAGR